MKDIQEIIQIYVKDYNQKLNKNLLVNEDFFGDTLRIIDFLNHYYTALIHLKDYQMIYFVLDHVDFIRKYIIGLGLSTKPSYMITDDEYRQARKGVHKVRKMIPSVSSKKDIFHHLLTSYQRYDENFKDQTYIVYTNDNIYNFELKEEYFPHVIGMNLEDKIQDVDTFTEKEKAYYHQIPEMLQKLSSESGLKSLDEYERKNYHSLFNYSYLKVKNISFLNFMSLDTPMFIVNNSKKVDSNVRTNTFFASPIKVGKKESYSMIGFHENSKFSQGYAESNVYLKDTHQIHGEMGITTAIFRKSKSNPSFPLELVKIFTLHEQIQFIDYILRNNDSLSHMKDLINYQGRLKRSLCDQINLEYQLKDMMYETLEQKIK